MNEQHKETLRYFKSVLERDKLVSLCYDNSNAYWLSDQQSFFAGRLDQEITEQLFDAFFKEPRNKNKKREEIKSIPLQASLKVVRLATGKANTAFQGLLNIECSLALDGTLDTNYDDFDPWIPADRMKTDKGISQEIMVGYLKDYWGLRRKKQNALNKPKDWASCLDYANSMFDKLKSDTEFPQPDDEYLHECVEEKHVYLRPGERILASSAVIDLYDSILQNNMLPATLKNIMCWDTPKCDVRKDVSPQAMSELGGCMSKEFFLADSQRTAVHAYVAMEEGDILAVSGPPGTGKTTMLQAVVASLIVKHAVEGKTAPVIVGSSTNNQAVTNIISSFSSVVPEEHGPLDYRWLIKVPSEDGEEDNGPQDTLNGIAAYCPAVGHAQAAIRDGYLVESTKKDGVYSKYSAPKYVVKAKGAFLEYAREYLGGDCSTIKNASSCLCMRLSTLDGARRTVVKAAHELVLAGDSTESRAMADRFTAEARLAQNNLRRWIEVESQRKKRHFWSRKPTDDTDLIVANRTFEDDFPLELGTIEAVKLFYKARYEAARDNAEVYSANAEKAEQDRTVYAEAHNELLSELKRCAQNPDIVEQFEQFDLLACDGDRLLALDQTLDVTVRYVEFWLAVHYYEAQWLEVCKPSKLIEESKRAQTTADIQNQYWSQVTALTPCMVMTEYQLPKYFRIFDCTAVGKRRPDCGRIDLMIIDEAGQVNTPVALPSFALAKRALVVGDVHQLAPVWSLDSEEDKSIAENAGLEVSNWNERGIRGLVASAPGSLMRVAANASKWRYNDTLDGLFLEEHYRCVDQIIELCNDLIYDGKLKPCRGDGSKLVSDDIAPVQYVVVPGSKDESVGSSRRNGVEAQAIIEWISNNRTYLERIYKKNVDEIVGVVTPFSAQAHLIQNELARRCPDLASKITIGTAHRLQGAECPVILFSLVYGDNSSAATFVEFMPELMNVAISRAKDLFIVFGSAERKRDEGKVLKVLVKGSTEGSMTLHNKSRSEILSETKPDFKLVPGPTLDSNAMMEAKSISQIVSGIDGMTASKANRILEENGLIMKAEKGWKVAPKGSELGIIEIAPHDDANYYMCKYGKSAEKYITDILRTLRL